MPETRESSLLGVIMEVRALASEVEGEEFPDLILRIHNASRGELIVRMPVTVWMQFCISMGTGRHTPRMLVGMPCFIMYRGDIPYAIGAAQFKAATYFDFGSYDIGFQLPEQS